MSDCCETGSGAAVHHNTGTVALVGNPNVGKSTLFNAATGARVRVGNWPGTTVGVAEGGWRLGEREVKLVDLPGTYSLLPASPDETVTRDALLRGESQPDVVVAVADAANLARSLYLLSQLLETERPIVVALTMTDVAAGRGTDIDTGRLSAALGVPVVPVVPRGGAGMDALAEAVASAMISRAAPDAPRLGADIDAAVAELLPHLPPHYPSRWLALAVLSGEAPDAVIATGGAELEQATRAARNRIDTARATATDQAAGAVATDQATGAAAMGELAGRAAMDVATHTAANQRAGAAVSDRAADAGATEEVAVPSAMDVAACAAVTDQPPGEGVMGRAAGAGVDRSLVADPDDDAEIVLAERRYAWAHEVLAVVVTRSRSAVTVTDRVDRVLTSRWLGVPVFLAIMWAVFQLTTTVAKPVQDWLGDFITVTVAGKAGNGLAALGAPDPLVGFVRDGLINGVGQLLSFVPLMLIMFVLLALLEDSGYMARAAFVADRLMRTMGLPGRAFLPLIVGFGCNVPAISGTRVLGDSRHRLLTALLIPFTSCNARLVVYVLVAGVFFGSNAGTVVFAMYVASIVLVVLIGLLLRGTLFRDMAGEPLVLDLPPYRRPSLRVMGMHTWQKMRGFLKTASGIIVATVTAVWLLSSIPAGSGSFGAVPASDSLFGAVSSAVAPVFAPAGFDDWHASAALVSGFVAKEAVVSTIAQSYSMDDPGDGAAPQPLADSLRATFDHASGGHPIPAVLAFLMFLLAYTPCMTTLAVMRLEIGTRWTLFSVALQLSVAWVLAVAVFQIGRMFW
ncbi:ferrous iron transport protein B [Nocardia crassostreae]|uniref:ferrous iron transport protein B n=1 Tax=Nocardia crassostreae TaxID=53428 RepID=UPI0008310B89|nr:ferrous iron transport protein B [Nocardia crassostreae]